MHASYSEVCDFIAYLKPRRIVPCVIPVGDASLSDVNRRLVLITLNSIRIIHRSFPRPKGIGFLLRIYIMLDIPLCSVVIRVD